MARVVFVTGWLDVKEGAHAVRSAIHSALANDRPDTPLAGPKLVTVTPSDGNLPVYVNPAQVVMVKTDPGEAP